MKDSFFCWSEWNMFIEHKMRAIEFGSLEIGEKRYKIEHRGEWKVGQISIRASSWLNRRQTGSWRGRLWDHGGCKAFWGQGRTLETEECHAVRNDEFLSCQVDKKKKATTRSKANILTSFVWQLPLTTVAGFPRDEQVFEPKWMCCSSFQQTWV